MKRSGLEIYALAISFIAAITFLTGTIRALNGAAGLAFPVTMMNQQTYTQVATNDAYWQQQRTTNFDAQARTYPQRPLEEELTQRRVEAFQQAVTAEKRNSGQSVIRGIIVALVSGLLFAFHWRIAKRQRELES